MPCPTLLRSPTAPVEQQGIDVDIEPGETVTVQVEVGAEPVVFTCKYHATLGMHGVLLPAAS